MKLYFIFFLSYLVIVNCQYYGQFQPNYDSNGNGFRAIRIQIPRSNFGLNSMNPFLFNPNQLMSPRLNEENPNEDSNENPQKSSQGLNPKKPNEQGPRVIGLPIGNSNFRIIIDPNLLNQLQPNHPNSILPEQPPTNPNNPNEPNSDAPENPQNNPNNPNQNQPDQPNQPNGPDSRNNQPNKPNSPVSIAYGQPFVLPDGRVGVINPDGSISTPNLGVNQPNGMPQPSLFPQPNGIPQPNLFPQPNGMPQPSNMPQQPKSNQPKSNQPKSNQPKSNQPKNPENIDPTTEQSPTENSESIDNTTPSSNQPENQARKANKPISQVSSKSAKDPKARPNLICTQA